MQIEKYVKELTKITNSFIFDYEQVAEKTNYEDETIYIKKIIIMGKKIMNFDNIHQKCTKTQENRKCEF